MKFWEKYLREKWVCSWRNWMGFSELDRLIEHEKASFLIPHIGHNSGALIGALIEKVEELSSRVEELETRIKI